MKAAVTKTDVALAMANRFGDVFARHERQPVEILPTGVPEIDDLLWGLPRGAITEIYGQASSGRTSLLISALAAATAHEEICAVVDCNDTFDLSTATQVGVDFTRVLWVRCDQNLERAFKAVDLILHAGGFGFVALNLCDVPAKAVRRIISSWWFRFRRAIEDTPTALIVLTPVAAVRSSATVVFEMRNELTVWRKRQIADNNEPTETRKITRGLSLVPSNQSRGGEALSLSHAQFIRELRVRVNRVKPVEQPNAVNFAPQFHLQR